jgi:hypothetical protein
MKVRVTGSCLEDRTQRNLRSSEICEEERQSEANKRDEGIFIDQGRETCGERGVLIKAIMTSIAA